MAWAIRIVSLLEIFFIVSAILCTGYAFYFFSKPMAVQTAGVPYHPGDASIEQIKMTTSDPEKDLFEVIPQRDLFTAAALRKDINLNNNAPLVNALPGNLKLVGVIIGTPSQLAIEDVNLHQTYFISKGGQDQGIDVVDIGPQQALLKFQGQDIALPLKTK